MHEKYLRQLPKSSSKRKLTDRLVGFAAIACIVIVLIPLVSIIYEVVIRGGQVINWQFLTDIPRGFNTEINGGLGPSIQGTLVLIGLASLVSVPVGILTGIYLSEFAGNGRFPSSVRLINDILAGMPSIVIGFLAFLTLVLVMGRYSTIAGAFALSIIMIPIVVRVTEESLRLIPMTVREAGHALGVQKWKVSMFVVLMAAKKGVLTGIVLGIARIAGETAPLLLTIGGTRSFFSGFDASVDAIPVRIFQYAKSPFDPANAAAWGGALILIVLVLILSVALRLIVEGKSFGTKSHTL
ncbi:MAG TPA: phosphate ABC transporter permease PstA [Nitrososphaera sp.]